MAVETEDSGKKSESPKKNGNSLPKSKFSLVDPPPELAEQRLKSVVRHITHVQQSCTLLGERLIASGEGTTGHKLIANGFIHDNSKFHGIEWLYLHEDIKKLDSDLFDAALMQHQTNNPHHPEYWDGIANMPRLYVAEMVCDWHARGHEFGTDMRNYIKTSATKKFGFTVQGKVYKEIKGLVDMLLDPAFS